MSERKIIQTMNRGEENENLITSLILLFPSFSKIGLIKEKGTCLLFHRALSI